MIKFTRIFLLNNNLQHQKSCNKDIKYFKSGYMLLWYMTTSLIKESQRRIIQKTYLKRKSGFWLQSWVWMVTIEGLWLFVEPSGIPEWR